MNDTLLSPSDRARVHARLDRLSPDRKPIWGTMSAGKMVCHVADQLRVALGDTKTSPRRITVRLGNGRIAISPGLLRFKPFRYLFVHRFPWPRASIGAPPEMWKTAPGEWREDTASLHALIDRVGGRSLAVRWGRHPWFGSVSGQEWGVLCWRHLDYHFRQFGV